VRTRFGRQPALLRAPAPRRVICIVFPCSFGTAQEKFMYIGGGILGTILIIALVVFLVRIV
jgi:hypothetical protein